MKNILPVRYQRVPVRALRTLPIRENPHIRILDYRRTDAPGMINGPARTHGFGSAIVADGYVVVVCITRDGGAWFLEIERQCYDEQAGGRTKTPSLSPSVLADLYHALQRRQIAAQAKRSSRGVGRN